MNINYIPGQRMTVIGKSGSGKSYFTLNIFRPKLKYRVIYDWKHEIKPLANEVIFNRPSDFKTKPGQPCILYRPYTGTDDEFNEMCDMIFKRGHTTLVIDDMSEHAPIGRIQRHHAELIRMGRSRECGIITLVQEPVGVHRLVFSQTDHFVVFETQLEAHRKKLAGFMGPEVMNIPEKHHFWYYGPETNNPVYMQPVTGREVCIRVGGV